MKGLTEKLWAWLTGAGDDGSGLLADLLEGSLAG